MLFNVRLPVVALVEAPDANAAVYRLARALRRVGFVLDRIPEDAAILAEDQTVCPDDLT